VQRRSLVLRSIWAACLLIGGANHARILLQHGFAWDYHGVGWLSAAYWSSLTLIDPLVAALLFVRPKLGIIATVALFVTNVGHNLFVAAPDIPTGEWLGRALSDPFILSQIGFMLFVLATARTAWNGVRSSSNPQPSR
jgi:hypothetical protein